MYRSETQSAFWANIKYFVRWTLISVVMGIVCGLVGTVFGKAVALAQASFARHTFLLWMMPVAGILIVLLHKWLHEVGNKGTNLILESISSNEKIRVSLLPCILSPRF